MEEKNNSWNDEITTLPKLPFRRLKYALDRVVKTAIPLHIEILTKIGENIENLKSENRARELRLEQIEASKAVQLLKSDLFELEQLNRQVREEDQDLFHQTVKLPLKDAVEVLSCFMAIHTDILGPVPAIEPENYVPECTEFPAIICDLSQPSEDKENNVLPIEAQEQLIVKSKPSTVGWSFLKKELLDIRSLIHQFSALVFRQQESIDTIQSNIVTTSENVKVGTEHLKKASLLKAATFPLAGAVVGGLILGPVGALAGFKILGSAACLAGGSAVGYGFGLKLKKTQEKANDIELKAITYPSKSLSNPELTKDKDIRFKNL